MLLLVPLRAFTRSEAMTHSCLELQPCGLPDRFSLTHTVGGLFYAAKRFLVSLRGSAGFSHPNTCTRSPTGQRFVSGVRRVSPTAWLPTWSSLGSPMWAMPARGSGPAGIRGVTWPSFPVPAYADRRQESAQLRRGSPRTPPLASAVLRRRCRKRWWSNWQRLH